MRIAYVCSDPGIPIFGTKGASVHVQEVVRALLARGHEVVLYAARRGDDVPQDLRDLRVVERRMPRTDPAEREHAIERTSDALAADVVAEGCDLVYERFSLFSRASALVARDTGVPTIVEVNAPLVDEQRRHRVLVDEARALRLATDVLSRATLTACVSEPVAAWSRALGARRAIVAPNGVNTARIRPSQSRRAPDTFTVGFVGTLKPWHGTEILVDAVSRMAPGSPRVRLSIVGDGPAAADLRTLARERTVDTEFHGALSPADVPGALATMDVGVAPYPESASEQYFSPLKIYEYLAAGLPVVASRVGQIPDVVRDGHTGILTRPGDADDLARALERLRTSRQERRRMSLAARAAAVAEHDWQRVVERILGAVEQEVPA